MRLGNDKWAFPFAGFVSDPKNPGLSQVNKSLISLAFTEIIAYVGLDIMDQA